MDNQYGDLLYYSEVRWLSRGAFLQRAYQVRDELAKFVIEKGMTVPELNDQKWMVDFAFLVDITNHLNILNLKLQASNQLIFIIIFMPLR